MPIVLADRQLPVTASEPLRQPLSAAAPVVAVSGAAVAARIAIVAGAVLLACAGELSTREFDSGWVLALIAALAALAALLALSLRHVGAFFDGFGARWSRMLQRRAQARADARFLGRAAHDPRLMAELQAAMSRQPATDAASAALRAKVEAVAGRL